MNLDSNIRHSIFYIFEEKLIVAKLKNIKQNNIRGNSHRRNFLRYCNMEVPQSRSPKSYFQVQQNCIILKYQQANVSIASFRKGSLLSIMF